MNYFTARYRRQLVALKPVESPLGEVNIKSLALG
jgi:hypothetical protein